MARGRRGITGPPPKPAALRRREGRVGHVAINKREPQPPAPAAAPPAPAALAPLAAAEWDRLTPILLQVRVLTDLDYAALASYCAAFARWWEAEVGLKGQPLVITDTMGRQRPNPLIRVARDAMGDMMMVAREYGFTPASRTRIMAGAKLSRGQSTQDEMDEAECFDT